MNVLIIQLNTILHLSSDCKDTVDWCHSSRYGCVDGRSWLEQDVIVSGHGVYLLIDNDSGGPFSSQQSVVKPDGEDDGAGCQRCGYNDSIVLLHGCSG